MSSLNNRISKLEQAAFGRMWDHLFTYWDQALEGDTEAEELREQLYQVIDTSELTPPCFFMPDIPEDGRRWHWVIDQDPQAQLIIDKLTKKVDKYIDSKGGIFAPKLRQ